MAAIVVAVLAVNLAVRYLGWIKGPDAPLHLLVTTFTTMVLLGIVATARHPKSYATWVTTAVNGCVMFLLLATTGDYVAAIFLCMLYTVALMVCVAAFRSSRGFRRSFRYYQISSFVNWITLDAMTWLVLSAGTV